jgi:xanthine dehydrogenase accessory factor
MSNFYHQLQDLLDDGLTVAVATVTATKGSTPRGIGTQMIVHPYGKHVGTVGGGCGEADVIRAGLDVISDGEARTVVVDLTEDISMQSLGVCGGVLDVFIARWQPTPSPAPTVP